MPNRPPPVPPPFPFTPEQIFDRIAECYSRVHRAPRRASIEGDAIQAREHLRAQMVNHVWPDFRVWWGEANEQQKRDLAEQALSSLLPERFRHIPDNLMAEVCRLIPPAGDPPFFNRGEQPR